MLRRAFFTFFVGNEDDHAKIFGFLPHDDGRGTLSPTYDLTFSPTRCGEHSTSFMGEGKTISAKALERMSSATIRLSRAELLDLARETAAGAETVAENARAPGVSKANVGILRRGIDERLTAHRKTLGL